MVASRPLRSLAVLVVCAVAAVAAAPFASADELPAGTPSDRRDVHLRRPGQAVDDYLAAESGSVMSAGRWSAGLFVDYESRPLVAVASSNGMRGDEVTVVDSSVLFDLTFAYGVYDRLQLGVDVAVVSEQAGTLDVGAGVGNQTRLGALRGMAGKEDHDRMRRVLLRLGHVRAARDDVFQFAGDGMIFGGKTIASLLVFKLVESIHANGTMNPAQIITRAMCVPIHVLFASLLVMNYLPW